MKKLLLGIALLVCSSLSFAQSLMPTPGVWWNPDESGRGYNIDYQNNVMTVTTYVYDKNGAQVWYSSAGVYDESSKTFTSTFNSATNGQCFGCAYRAPTVAVNSGGPMKIVFDSLGSGTLYFNGGSSKIQRYFYAFDGSDKKTIFYGEWVLSYVDSTTKNASAHWVVFYDTYLASDGTVYLKGVLDSKSGTLALATYESGEYGVAINDGTANIYLYEFSEGDENRMIGALYTATTSNPTPTGSGKVAVGNRLLSNAEISATNGATQADSATLHALEQQLRTFRQAERK